MNPRIGGLPPALHAIPIGDNRGTPAIYRCLRGAEGDPPTPVG